MIILKSMAAWLGRLSVSRKLTLIYLLDLTAVIYISGILVHEKYLAIDFTRKEVAGVAYGNTVRDLLMAAVSRSSCCCAATRLKHWTGRGAVPPWRSMRF